MRKQKVRKIARLASQASWSSACEWGKFLSEKTTLTPAPLVRIYTHTREKLGCWTGCLLTEGVWSCQDKPKVMDSYIN